MLSAKELRLNLEHSNVCKFNTSPQKRPWLQTPQKVPRPDKISDRGLRIVGELTCLRPGQNGISGHAIREGWQSFTEQTRRRKYWPAIYTSIVPSAQGLSECGLPLRSELFEPSSVSHREAHEVFRRELPQPPHDALRLAEFLAAIRAAQVR